MNESRTCSPRDTDLTQRRSPPVPRFRLIDPAGKRYAPFRMKPGVPLAEILPKTDGWELEAA